MPRLRIDKAFAKRIKALWGAHGMKTSPIRNPINSFDAYKFKAKQAGSKHATIDALSETVRMRVMNGPELNILFLGIPFLVDFGVDWGLGKMQEKKATVKSNYVKKTTAPVQASHQVNDGGVRMPAPAPYSDKTVGFYCDLLNAGMTEDAALCVANGQYQVRDASDQLSQDDQRILLEVLAKYAPDQVAAVLPPGT
jgi:hypothetical protein